MYYLIYGNHGKSPIHMEDYLAYLKLAITSCGHEALMSENPVPGAHNIIIECFHDDYVPKILEAARVPGTKFTIIVTEHLTGETFNNFGADANSTVPPALPRKTGPSSRQLVAKFIGVVFPPKVRRMVLRVAGTPYLAIRERYYAWNMPVVAPVAVNAATEAFHYWRMRYLNFNRIIDKCEAIWCFTPPQLAKYHRRYPKHRSEIMPLVAFSAQPLNLDQGRYNRDIDFLFTGTVTPHRASVFAALKQRGYNVVVGPPSWPSAWRDHFIARSKACLQVLQTPEWEHPSTMRYHYLLCSGAVVVAEQAGKPCFEDAFITVAPGGEFLDACERVIKRGHFLEEGRQQCASYFAACAPGREEFRRLLREAKVSPNFPDSRVLNPREPDL